MIILKVTKNQVSTLALEDTSFEKPQGEGGRGGGAVNLKGVVLGLSHSSRITQKTSRCRILDQSGETLVELAKTWFTIPKSSKRRKNTRINSFCYCYNPQYNLHT